SSCSSMAFQVCEIVRLSLRSSRGRPFSITSTFSFGVGALLSSKQPTGDGSPGEVPSTEVVGILFKWDVVGVSLSSELSLAEWSPIRGLLLDDGMSSSSSEELLSKMGSYESFERCLMNGARGLRRGLELELEGEEAD